MGLLPLLLLLLGLLDIQTMSSKVSTYMAS